MRYITKEELRQLPSYPWIEQALFFGSDYAGEDEPLSRYQASRKVYPFTRDGYVAVQALYNLSSWRSWKSSSLSSEERDVAGAIGGLKLYELMRLNEGRRKNQPALFPEGDLLSE